MTFKKFKENIDIYTSMCLNNGATLADIKLRFNNREICSAFICKTLSGIDSISIIPNKKIYTEADREYYIPIPNMNAFNEFIDILEKIFTVDSFDKLPIMIHDDLVSKPTEFSLDIGYSFIKNPNGEFNYTINIG